jgi:hypothetical protein
MHVHVRSPLFLESVQSDFALCVHVQVVDAAGKYHLRCIEWVGFGEVD